jgi:aspartyl-tRNA(Asn)/glutamyl-tRNA(Gln) amidotransferase subunit A
LSATLDSIGPLAPTVAACAIADAVMAGEEPAPLTPIPLAGIRVGIPCGALFEDTEDGVGASFDRCLHRIELAGARLVDVSIDDLLAEMRVATRRGSIAAMEGAEVHADWLATGAPVPVDVRVSWPLARAALLPAPVYIRTMHRRTALAAAMDERLASVECWRCRIHL